MSICRYFSCRGRLDWLWFRCRRRVWIIVWVFCIIDFNLNEGLTRAVSKMMET